MNLVRRIKNSSLTTLLCVLLIPAAMFSQTKNKKEMENKKKKLRQEINTTNELLRETKNSKKKTMGEVAILNTKISIRQELIATINSEIKQINNKITVKQKEVDEQKANLEKLKKEYAKMVYYAYRNKDSYNRLMFMFASGNFNQAYQRLKYIQQYNEFRRKQALEIVKTQEEIKVNIASLESTKQEKQSLLTGEEQEQQNLAKEKTEQEGLLVQLQDKEKQLKEDLKRKQKESDALSAAIKKLIQEEIIAQQKKAREAAIARANAKKKKEELAKLKNEKEKSSTKVDVNQDTGETDELSADFASNKGKLPWPVVKGVITDHFGTHEHPTIRDFEINNDGVDISTTKGAACRALFDGEVSAIINMTGKGNVIIIRHGEYLTVYTNLDKVNVKRGDKITSKQSIGTLAYDDDDSRTVMNLQIWKGQKKLNPEEWLYK